MSHTIKNSSVSVLSLYISKECPAFNELVKAIRDIPEDKFVQVIDQEVPVNQRIHYLLDEIIFFINQYYPISHEQGSQLDNPGRTYPVGILLPRFRQASHLTAQVEFLQNQINVMKDEQIETKKLRIIAEILTPIVKEIRNDMIHRHIPDYYYTKSIINACLLYSKNENITWEIAEFNRDNPQTSFNINTFNELEGIIRDQTNILRINYQTFIELLLMKFDRNQIKHDSIKKFIRSDKHRNTSFHGYLTSIGVTNIFNMNEKLCLKPLYRNHFLNYYNSM
ncbi:hypothetical protein I4U23_025530 [Adineta vaga]|nr:hypothetical protein I4U23_025530 [Adineta vaga]